MKYTTKQLTELEHVLAKFLGVSHDHIALHDEEKAIFTGKDHSHITGLYYVVEGVDEEYEVPQGYKAVTGNFRVTEVVEVEAPAEL